MLLNAADSLVSVHDSPAYKRKGNSGRQPAPYSDDTDLACSFQRDLDAVLALDRLFG